LKEYRDRSNGQNWTHIFNDIAVLESRHAFQGKDDKGKPVNNQLEVALALLDVYFNTTNSLILPCLTPATPPSTDQNPYWERFFEQDGYWNLYNGVHKYEPNGDRISTGILGDRAFYTRNKNHDGALNISGIKQALTHWIINLAKIGFHLCPATKNSTT
jgi:CRISPR-associated protein Cmr2